MEEILKLLEENNYSKAQKELNDLHPADIVDIFDELDQKEMT